MCSWLPRVLYPAQSIRSSPESEVGWWVATNLPVSFCVLLFRSSRQETWKVCMVETNCMAIKKKSKRSEFTKVPNESKSDHVFFFFFFLFPKYWKSSFRRDRLLVNLVLGLQQIKSKQIKVPELRTLKASWGWLILLFLDLSKIANSENTYFQAAM